MPDGSGSDKAIQQAAVAGTPNGAATVATQGCAGSGGHAPATATGTSAPASTGGHATAGGTGAGAAAAAPTTAAQATPPPLPVIVKVEWLDGAGNAVLAGQGLQFVNLPVDDKWVSDKLAGNKRRLGDTPGYKVTFNLPGSHAFKVKLKPGGSNAVYSSTELARNAHFVAHTDWIAGSTDADGTKVIETGAALSCSGGDTYTLEGQDDHATLVASASSIKTLRAVFVNPIKMTGLGATASSIADAIGEYAGHHLRLIELPSAAMTRVHNVGTDTAVLQAAVSTAWDGSQGKAQAPYALGAVFTDHLAVQNPHQTLSKSGVQVGPGKPAVVIPVVGAGLTNSAISFRSLWIDLVPGEDWFVSATYTPDGGAAAHDVTKARCTPKPVSSSLASDCTSVTVDVSALPASTGTLTLTVNWVDRMRGGISLGGLPTVLICTRAWWRDKSAAAQNQVLVHELGHQFGMVPVGSGSSLDRHADQYTASGHVGSHCHHGVATAASYGTAASTTASNCVIFGATNGKLAYCSLCAPQVRKLDLASGW